MKALGVGPQENDFLADKASLQGDLRNPIRNGTKPGSRATPRQGARCGTNALCLKMDQPGTVFEPLQTNQQMTNKLCNRPPDGVFQSDNATLNEVVELIWLEEGMYCLSCPEFQFDFIYRNASPALVELRKLSLKMTREGQNWNRLCVKDSPGLPTL
jgi:hypothetical protein